MAYTGFAPIHIVAAASQDALDKRTELGEKEYFAIEGSLSNIVEFLIKTGARISIDPPKDRRRGAGANNVNKANRNIQPLKEFGDLLGSYRLKTSEMAWQSMKSVNVSRKNYIFHTDKSPIEDSMAPGGSDEKSCCICWKAFGIMNRKHRCRISRRHICDECSTKRVVESENGEEHRVSDGQFLLARADGIHRHELELERRNREKETQAAAAAARLERLEAEEAEKRDSLFGGVLDSMSKAVFGEETEEASKTTSRDVQGLSDTLGQTRDALNERGEKLNTLAEKSDKLVEASRDFASMATELNKQTQKGLFW